MPSLNENIDRPYTLLLQRLRAMFEDALKLNGNGESIDPDFLVAKMESLRTQNDAIRPLITMIRSNAVTLRYRTRKGKDAA